MPKSSKTLDYYDVGETFNALDILKEKGKNDFVDNINKNDNSALEQIRKEMSSQTKENNTKDVSNNITIRKNK
mgnify:CR=1 FL=1